MNRGPKRQQARQPPLSGSLVPRAARPIAYAIAEMTG
jgi:hypothetical protein